MIVYKNVKDKVPSNQSLDISNVEDIKKDYYSVNLTNSGIVVLDVDDEQSREIILQLHKGGKLNDYVYAIKENGSAHFYFSKDNLHKSVQKNNHNYFSISNLIFEVKFENKVQISHPDYTYVNYEKLLSWKDNTLPQLDTQDVIFSIIGFINTDKSLHTFRKMLNITTEINNLYNATQGDGTRRAKTILSITTKMAQKGYTWFAVQQLITLIENYYLSDSITTTDGSKAFENLIEKAHQYYLENAQSNNFDESENDNWNINLDNSSDIKMVDEKTKSHQDFLLITTKGNKTSYKIDEYKLALWLIQHYHLKVRESQVYGFNHNNHYVNMTKIQENINELLFLMVAKIFEEYDNSQNFKLANYNNIKDIICHIAPPLTDDILSEMNISVANGTLVYNYEEKKYHFVQEHKPHIISFNHIYWFDENENFDIDRYNYAKKQVDTYLSSLVSKDNVKTLWQMIATTFLFNTFHRKSFILTGSGKNGKSTFIQFLQKINGNNHSNISLKDLNSQFMGHKIFNTTLNVCGEMDGIIDGTDSILKSIIAGDKISMDVKHEKNGLDFVSKATLIFASNHDLIFTNYTTALLDRLLFIDFNKTFANLKISNFLDSILVDKYAYYYILKKSIFLIEELDKTNWKITSIDDDIQQKKFKYRNSIVYRWFVKQKYLTNDLLTDKGFEAIITNDCDRLYKLFKQGVKAMYDENKTYGYHKFEQQLKDVLKMKVELYDDGNQYFIPFEQVNYQNYLIAQQRIKIEQSANKNINQTNELDELTTFLTN